MRLYDHLLHFATCRFDREGDSTQYIGCNVAEKSIFIIRGLENVIDT